MMTEDPVFACRERIDNRFQLCALAFERARQLVRGANHRTTRRAAGPVMTALHEIAAGHVQPTDNPTFWRLA